MNDEAKEMNRACRIPSQFTHSQFIIRVKSKRKNRCFIRTDQCYYYYHISPIFFFVGPVCVFFQCFLAYACSRWCRLRVYICVIPTLPSTILLSFFSVYSEGSLLKFSIAAYLNLEGFFPCRIVLLGGWSGVIRSNSRQCEVKDRTAAAIRIEKILWRNTLEGRWIAILEPQTVRSEQWRRWTAYSRLVPDNSTWKKARNKDWRWAMSAESIRLQMCLDGSLFGIVWTIFLPVPINLLFLNAMDPNVALGTQKINLLPHSCNISCFRLNNNLQQPKPDRQIFASRRQTCQRWLRKKNKKKLDPFHCYALIFLV